MKAVNVLTRILELLTALTFSVMIIVVLIQISGRYLPITFVWTEELTRYLFVYSIAFGAPVAMERRGYISVDLLVDLLPAQIKKYYTAFIYLVLGLFSSILVFYSYEFALVGEGQTSATLKIEMTYIFSSMLIAFVFLGLYSFLNIYFVLSGSKELRKEGAEA